MKFCKSQGVGRKPRGRGGGTKKPASSPPLCSSRLGDMAHFFGERQHRYLEEALFIAEERVFDFFKLSFGQGLRVRYDISTAAQPSPEEIAPGALAMVAKYDCRPQGRVLKSQTFDFYRIYLQDHNMMQAAGGSPELHLLPLLIYVLTHELVHIVRFSRHQALYDTPAPLRSREEQQVHLLTQKILAPVNLMDLPAVIKWYNFVWQGKEVGRMPIYEYQCAGCGEIIEKWQKFSEAPLTTCPGCGGALHKVISQSAFHLKGSGWYVTDYTGSRKPLSDTAKESKESGESKESKESGEASSGSEGPKNGQTESSPSPKVS